MCQVIRVPYSSLVPTALEEECKEGGAAETRGKPGNDGILLAEGNKVFYAEDAAHSTNGGSVTRCHTHVLSHNTYLQICTRECVSEVGPV